MMERDETNPVGDETKIISQEQRSVREGWSIRGINHARGYAKLVNISTGEKVYAALLDFPGYRTRLSQRLFSRAESAADRRWRIRERLIRIRLWITLNGEK